MIIYISASCILIFLLVVVYLALRVPVGIGSGDDTSAIHADTSTEMVNTVLSFPQEALQGYVARMKTMQPVFNDRLLDGEGKNHTLSKLASVASTEKTSVVSVLQQVGDTFS